MPCSHGIAFSLKYSHMNAVRQGTRGPGRPSGSSDRPCMDARSARVPPASSTKVGAMSCASTIRDTSRPASKARG
jgi:hypothetical protein